MKEKYSTSKRAEEQLYEAWMNDQPDTALVDDEITLRIKERIDRRTIGLRRWSLARVAQMAACFLLPLFVALTIYLYHANRQFFSKEVTVFTAAGERANVMLPDSTTIVLNAKSILTYRPETYNKGRRDITFEGEGYFRVTKNPEAPFVIHTEALRVTVLGTVFNLNVRKGQLVANLSLEQGSVHLYSEKTHEGVLLHPHYQALLNCFTGHFSVSPFQDPSEITAWTNGELRFHNTELRQVLSTLENSYDIHIQTSGTFTLDDLFTGTMPCNNLHEVLEILSSAFHATATVDKKQVLLTKK
jgi:ferric-dicitrate binding protein FerR (iron transport regulator)